MRRLQVLILLHIHVISQSCHAYPVSSIDDNDNDAGLYWSDLSVTTTPAKVGANSNASTQPDCDRGTTLLHPVSGCVLNGQICGVIGPSGSGKSTLLAALGGGFYTNPSLYLHGHVWLQSNLLDTDHFRAEITPNVDNYTNYDNEVHNNTKMQQCEATFVSQQFGQVAFLQQQDSFFHLLTVRETMELAAFLEFPTRPKSERTEYIDRTLDALGLASVADRLVGDRSQLSAAGAGGGLSGGERRRLSVGMELLSTPRVFLADESTTGLDSSQAVKIVKLIADLAKERHIPAILSLHQPRASIWKILDSFILLAPGGRVCYMGSRQSALSYFQDLGYSCPEETNPAEFFIDLVSVDTEDAQQAKEDEARIDFLFQAFQATQEYIRKKEPCTSKRSVSSKHKGTPFRRFGALLLRSWRQNIRNTRYTVARAIACLGCSTLFSQIFKSVRDDVPYARSIADRTALLSYGVINMCMMALLKTVHLFSKERPVVEREQMRQQYSSLEYLLCKVLAEIPLDTLFATIFTTVLKALTGLRISLAQLTSTFATMTAAGASLGFAIGSWSKDGDTAMAYAMPIMVLFMVVGVINPSGVDKKSSPPPIIIKLLQTMSPIKWAMEAVIIAEFDGVDLRPKGHRPWQQIRDLPKFGAFAMVRNGDQILSSLGLDNSSYNGAMKHMALISLVNLGLTWIGLERNRKGNPKRPQKQGNQINKHSRRDTNFVEVIHPPVVVHRL